MPELPEVETIKSGLEPLLINKRVIKANFYQPKLRFLCSDTWKEQINSARINDIKRKAKYLYFEMEKDNSNFFLLWHLGMSGSMTVIKSDTPLKKHDHIELFLNNKKSLRYNDPRRFGFLKLYNTKEEANDVFCNYGPEPLSNNFSAKYLFEICKNKKKPIKNLLMDQKNVVGVGNIYACEALFISKIHPNYESRSLSFEQIDLLVKNIKIILKEAIKKGGTTLKDFKNIDSKPGYFQQSLLVYGRSGDSCTNCNNIIERSVIGGRSSFYCPSCQKPDE